MSRRAVASRKRFGQPAAGCSIGVSDDRGMASFVAVTLIGVLVLLGMAANFVVATAAAHRGAQAAADLAALAGAARGQSGGDACAAATELATANRFSLSTCVVDGAQVLVTVHRDGPTLFGHSFEVSARARAGPAG